MSTMYGAPTAAQGTVEYVSDSGLAAALQRRWAAYVAWRSRRAAMIALGTMSDLELEDIGLPRCDILRAVRGEVARDRTLIRRG